jgi:hypothetical protein
MYYGGFDLTYWLFMIPGMLLGALATAMLKSRIAAGHKRANQVGLTGRDVAQRLLDANGIRDVRIEQVAGFLSDHYMPSEKVVRLSPEIYSGRTVSSLAVAAHECGHAIQHQQAYAPLSLRTISVPLAVYGPQAAMVFMIAGSMFAQLSGLMIVGLVLFSFAVLFSLITLPVEFNASRRALAQLVDLKLTWGDEYFLARKVLVAAALTYVAAAVMAIFQFLYFAYRMGLFGNRRR